MLLPAINWKLVARKLFVSTALFVVITIISGALFIEYAPAQISAGLPFGGRQTNVVLCTCSFGAVVTVGPPRGGVFLYQPGLSQTYSFYQIPRVGPWLLGLYGPPGSCLIFSGKGCAPVFHQGTITIVGTSL